MNPSVDDRLASVVRAITDVILPSIPADAGLAREQTQLVIGHLQILRAQLDAVPAFEQEELSDARALAAALLAKGQGGASTTASLNALRDAESQSIAGEHHRDTRRRINQAIDGVIRSCAADGSAAFRAALEQTVIAMEDVRSRKDRKWFSPMGFDSGIG
jgi:hypothetical protein